MAHPGALRHPADGETIPGDDRFLRPAVERTFNRISVDGDCSTNDAVVLLAPRGEPTGGVVREAAFAEALESVCRNLARQIVADGEASSLASDLSTDYVRLNAEYTT